MSFFTLLFAVILGNIITEFVFMWLFDDDDDDKNLGDNWER